MSQPSDPNVPPHAQVIQIALSFFVSQAIYAVAKLGVPDLMKDGPRDAAELARETQAHPGALYRVLRSLASFGFFREVSKGRFENTELGETLRADHPGRARSSVLALAGPAFWSGSGELLHSVRTGGVGFEKAMGMQVFDYLSQNPEEAGHFNEAMIGFHGAEPPAVANAYDSTGITRLVDVGGGSGNLITTILRAHTSVKGVLYDLPHVADVAKGRIKDLGLEDRCQVVSGSFFEQVPEGDAYTLSHIIHDWDEERCITILGNCRKASPKAKVQVIEMVIPEGDTPHPGKFTDLVMLTIPGGQERTEGEYAELFQKAGYRLHKVIPTESPVSIIEGVPA